MTKHNGQRSRWVETEAAKHTTPESIRKRIAYEQKQIQALASTTFGRDIEKAWEAHQELIQVLSERLSRAGKQSP